MKDAEYFQRNYYACFLIHYHPTNALHYSVKPLRDIRCNSK